MCDYLTFNSAAAALRRPRPAFAAGAAWAVCGFGLGGLDLGLVEHLALEDPDLDADDAVGGLRFGQAVVDVGAEGVQRHAALAIPLGARDLRSVQAAGHAHLDAERAAAHGAHHRALHRAAEHHALLDLLRDALGHQLRIELGLADLGDVEAHVLHRHAQQLGAAARSFSMSSPFLPITMPGRAVWMVMLTFGGALDQDAADRGIGELLLQELAHQKIGVHVRGKLSSCRHTTSTSSRA